MNAKRKTKQEVWERSVDIFRSVVSGEKYKDVAGKCGISVERARQGFFLAARFISRQRAIDVESYCETWDIDKVRAKKDLWLSALNKATSGR